MDKSFKDVLWENMETKGLVPERVYQLTGIPKHYLEAIFRGEWNKLPAAPYARGYFKKLESLLGVPDNHFWQLYKEEISPKVSGPTDKLPGNRYAIRTGNRKWSWLLLAVLAIGVYLLLGLDRFLGVPELQITNPSNALAVSTLPNFVLTGQMNSKDKLLINGEEMYIDKNGGFEKIYNLQAGLNTFEIVAKRFLGGETKIVKQVIYQPTE